MGIVLADSFAGRTVGAGATNPVTGINGWGTSSDGHAWATKQHSGAPAASGVSGGEGRSVGDGGGTNLTHIETLDTSTRADSEMLYRFQIQNNTSDSFSGIFRFADTSNYWQIGIGTPAGTIVARVRRRSAAVNSDTTVAFTINNGTFYWCRARLQGSQANVKVWQDGTAEPGPWTLSVTDAGAPTAAGLNGIAVYGFSTTTDDLLDNLTVDDLVGTSGIPRFRSRYSGSNRYGRRYRWRPDLSGGGSGGPGLFFANLTVVTTTVPSLTKQVGKVMSVTTTTAPTLTKQVGKVLSVTTTTSPSLAKQIGKVLSAVTTTAPTLTKQIGKVLSVVTTTAPTLTKLIGKTLTAVTTTAPSILTAKLKIVVLSVVTTTVPSLTKQVGKVLSVATTTAPTLTKQVGKVLSAVTTTAATLTTIKVKIVVLSVVTTTVPAITRQVGKVLSVVSTTTPTVTKAISKTLSATANTAPTLTKSIGRTLVAIATGIASAIAVRLAPTNPYAVKWGSQVIGNYATFALAVDAANTWARANRSFRATVYDPNAIPVYVCFVRLEPPADQFPQGTP